MEEIRRMKNLRSIFIVEDSMHDYALIERAFNKNIANCELRHFECGESLLDNVIRMRKETKSFSPSLIILDLNLPGLNGLDLLEILRKEFGMKNTPIILLSTSGQDVDVHTSYKRGANTYFMKPFRYEDYNTLVGSIVEYWFSHALLSLD